MDEPIERNGSNIIATVLTGQLIVGALLAALFWWLVGHVAGYSALLGSLTCVIPNAFLATRIILAGRDPGARALIRPVMLQGLWSMSIHSWKKNILSGSGMPIPGYVFSSTANGSTSTRHLPDLQPLTG